MNQRNTMAGKTAADLVQAIATSLYGEAGAGITDLVTLANRVKASAAGGLGLLLDQQRVTVVTDHSQAVAPTAVRAHEVHPEVVDVRLDPAEVRELCPAPDALVHCPGVRHEDDRLMTQAFGGSSVAGPRPSHPLLAVARRNIRQFLAKAAFASEMDRFSAGQCMDVIEAAIGAPPAQAVDLAYSLDLDPAGIRARVADVITGTLMVGAQGHTPPPAGHWAEPFWKAARADATAQAVDLGPVRAALLAAEALCVCCASVDGYSRNELHAFGVNMRSQFRDALARIDGKATANG